MRRISNGYVEWTRYSSHTPHSDQRFEETFATHRTTGGGGSAVQLRCVPQASSRPTWLPRATKYCRTPSANIWPTSNFHRPDCRAACNGSMSRPVNSVLVTCIQTFTIGICLDYVLRRIRYGATPEPPARRFEFVNEITTKDLGKPFLIRVAWANNDLDRPARR